MRGNRDPQLAMLSTLSTEDLIPADHPIRRIRAVVETVLVSMYDVFDGMYSTGGRPSVPPETLLKRRCWWRCTRSGPSGRSANA